MLRWRPELCQELVSRLNHVEQVVRAAYDSWLLHLQAQCVWLLLVSHTVGSPDCIRVFGCRIGLILTIPRLVLLPVSICASLLGWKGRVQKLPFFLVFKYKILKFLRPRQHFLISFVRSASEIFWNFLTRGSCFGHGAIFGLNFEFLRLFRPYCH